MMDARKMMMKAMTAVDFLKIRGGMIGSAQNREA